MVGINIPYRQPPEPIALWQQQSTPTSQEPEVVPYVFYDTQQYPAAGLAGGLNYFANVNADSTLSNMQTAGSLPNPQWFKVFKVFVDILGVPTAAGLADARGPVNDIELITKSARATLTFTMANKTYGPWPLTFFGSSGGLQNPVAVTLAAGAIYTAGSLRDNGGFPINGSVIIPPQVNFGWTLNGVNTIAISAATQIRVSMAGLLARLTR